MACFAKLTNPDVNIYGAHVLQKSAVVDALTFG